MSEWPGGWEGRFENRTIEVQSTHGQSWPKHWQELKWRCDKWENKSSDGVRFYGGTTGEGGGCVGWKNFAFSPALMKSCETVTGYRSLNPDVAALPNSSWPAADRSLWLTLFLLCSSSNLCATYVFLLQQMLFIQRVFTLQICMHRLLIKSANSYFLAVFYCAAHSPLPLFYICMASLI